MSILAAEVMVKGLEQEGVEVVFGYPGGAILPFYEALSASSIEHVLVRNEQSAAHMASGYSRVSGKTGVCIATSGPGATNLITGIATAYQDSIALVVITGQVPEESIGRDMFQEADIVGASESFTKHNYLVQSADQLQRILKEAFFIASTGRPGPVLIDVPKDIQKALVKENALQEDPSLRGYKPKVKGNHRQVLRAVKRIQAAKKPLLCIGGGIRLSKAERALKTFVSKTKMPLVSTMMGVDAYPNDGASYLGMIGSHGYSFAKEAMAAADLIIVIGARLGDRTLIGLSEDVMGNMIHIDIDAAEIGKIIQPKTPVVADAKWALDLLNSFEYPPYDPDFLNGFAQRRKAHFKGHIPLEKGINPMAFIMDLSKVLPEDTVAVSDVGQNQIWAAHYFMNIEKRRYLTSGGLGTMGYSLPAAIGACWPSKDRKVLAMMGDGGFQMLMSELALVKKYQLNVILLVFNNQRLGMVRELQDHAYGHTFGIDLEGNPDFIKLAKAYDIPAVRLASQSQVASLLKKIKDSKGPLFIECVVPSDFPTLKPEFIDERKI